MVRIGSGLPGRRWRDLSGRVGVDSLGPTLYYVGMVKLGRSELKWLGTSIKKL